MKWMIYYSILIAAILLVGTAQLAIDTNDRRYGLDVEHPGFSCEDIYEKNSYTHGKSGHYLIKTDDLFLAQCDMEVKHKSKQKVWMKIADIDIGRGDKCPKEWRKITVDGIEMCRSPNDTAGCYSTFFSVNGTSYSKIHGMVRGYQQGTTDSFDSRMGFRSINTAYVDGVSITLGYPRKHVWTYVVGCSDDGNYPTSNCPCAAIPGPAPPSFVGEHYYCESGNNGTYEFNIIFADDPLWDGAGCFHTNNNCCTNVGLPWFYREFPTSQHEDIEVRICADQGYNDEAVLVDKLKLYVL